MGITRAVIRRIEQKQCNDVDDYFAEIYYYLERSDKKQTWNAMTKMGLMVACSKGHTDIVQLLLQHKPEVDYQGVDGKMALHTASMYSYGEKVKALVEAKANITLTTHKGQTACDLAVSKGYHKIIDMLSTDPKH